MPKRTSHTLLPREPSTSLVEQPSVPASSRSSSLLEQGMATILKRDGWLPANSAPSAPRRQIHHPASGRSRGGTLSVAEEQRRIWLIHETALIHERIARAAKDLGSLVVTSEKQGLQDTITVNCSSYRLAEIYNEMSEYQTQFGKYDSELQEFDRRRDRGAQGGRVRESNSRRSGT